MTGAHACWDEVRVRYPYAARDAVGPVSLGLAPGERLLLLGPSDSGKSTLLQTLTGLIPQSVPAAVSGSVTLNGVSVAAHPPSHWARTVSQLFQDAEQTLCGLSVEDEIAFALENEARPAADIGRRVAAAMASVGLPDNWRSRRISTLSGGERQMVALAATLAADAPIFVADEPTASLAPAVAARMIALLLGGDRLRTVLVVDHRLDGMIRHVDRVVVLDRDGAVLVQGPPGPVFRDHGDRLEDLGIWTPLVSRFDRALMRAGLAAPRPPAGNDDLISWLDGLRGADRHRAFRAVEPIARDALPAVNLRRGGPVARLEQACCAPLFGPVVLSGISLAVCSGEVLGILGANGAGKSTLGGSLAGLLRLRGGRRHGPAGGMAFQNPENQFTQASVRDEVRRASADDSARAVAEALEDWGLGEVAGRHPFELSQGQKRRLALATLTVSDRWPLLVLDEPTSGLDAASTRTVARHIRRLAAAGRALAVITHDLDFALKVCDRAAVLQAGAVSADAEPVQIFHQAGLLADAGLRAPEVLPMLDWVEGKRHRAGTDRC
ncbi:energy-coupling factor transport system ATP-binding protein [Hoeflea marina]|uniref:Energy-coupling factor transport system ATP-binding protein n=1 Tax=Hoeflea marina TaxID=274592 RepID=A0A317PRC1_9HYPH|nr:ATP-binding cassette domain-containing protein [Hoeflea marina]PWW01424.1 energy-coupling factor transport system ATP-binding protein [Hoeflea marina]